MPLTPGTGQSASIESDYSPGVSDPIYRRLFDWSPTAIVISTLDGRVITANRHALEYSGYTLEELRRVGTTGVYAHAEDRARITELLRRQGHVSDLEVQLLHKDGPARDALISVRMTDLAGQPVLLTTFLDITRLKQADVALAESERKYRTLFESSSDAIMLLDQNEFFDCNEATLRIFGCSSRAQFLGKHPGQVSPPRQPDGTDSRTAANDRIGTAIREGRNFFPWVHRRADGTDFPAEVLLTPLDYHGRRVLQATVRDVTERVRAEQSRRNLSQAVEQSPASIVITDRNGTIEYVNPKFTEITGYSREEAIGQNPRILKTGHTNSEEYRRLWETINSGHEWRGEFLNRRKDGGLFWEAASISPVYDEDGELRHFVAVKEDITQRKRTEDQLHLDERRFESLLRISQYPAQDVPQLLDFALQEAISLTGSKIGYIYRYREERQEFTLNTWSRDVMQECRVLEPKKTYQLDATGIWGEAVRQRKPVLVNDFAAPNPLKRGAPAGHVALYRYLTIPVISQDHIVAVVGVANKTEEYDRSDVMQLTLLTDALWKIVERRSAEESDRAKSARLEDLNRNLELEQRRLLDATESLTLANEELRRLSDAKSEFVAAASHDLRTPLVTILESLRLIDDEAVGPVSPEQREYLGYAIQQTRRLRDLINNLLDVARIERGKPIVVRPVRVNVVEHLRQMKAGNEVLARASGLRIDLELPARPVSIFCDDGHYYRILTNLLSNAINYTPAGGTITLRVEALPDVRVRTTVRDTGLGIPRDQHSRVFQKFEQVQRANSTQHAGTGLGLALCRQLVELNHGTIGFESDEGKGSTFWFVLPAYAETKNDPKRSENDSRAAGAATPFRAAELSNGKSNEEANTGG